MNRKRRRGQAARRHLKRHGLPKGTDWEVIKAGSDIFFFMRGRGLVTSAEWTDEIYRRTRRWQES